MSNSAHSHGLKAYKIPKPLEFVFYEKSFEKKTIFSNLK